MTRPSVARGEPGCKPRPRALSGGGAASSGLGPGPRSGSSLPRSRRLSPQRCGGVEGFPPGPRRPGPEGGVGCGGAEGACGTPPVCSVCPPSPSPQCLLRPHGPPVCLLGLHAPPPPPPPECPLHLQNTSPGVCSVPAAPACLLGPHGPPVAGEGCPLCTSHPGSLSLRDGP